MSQVGVFANVRGEFSVVEYSDIAPEVAKQTYRAGNLVFSASHLCINYYTLDFLQVPRTSAPSMLFLLAFLL